MTNQETTWTIYGTNDEALKAMLEDCARAERSIVLEQYIFERDEMGNKIIAACAERAAKGVSVRFLWDAGGSFSLFGSNVREELRKKGINLLFWRTLIPGYYKVPNIRSWFLRDHRRTLVIDGKIGYTGSMCIKDEWQGWRDSNARFEGHVVTQMEESFERMWRRASGASHLSSIPGGRDHRFRYMTNEPTPRKRELYRALVEAIRHSRQYIYLTTPYFVPTRRLARVLRLAAHRGVDVRMIMPERTNHYPALDLGARSFFTSMLKSGVRIFLYPNRNGDTLIHGKTAVIDGEWSTVGSLNLDNVSLLYNYEANVVSTDSKFAEEVAAHFVHDMHKCREITPEEWKSRFFLDRLPEYAILLVRKFL